MAVKSRIKCGSELEIFKGCVELRDVRVVAISIFVLVLSSRLRSVEGSAGRSLCNPFTASVGAWRGGTATFYSGGRGGACGFGGALALIYGQGYAAVSSRLWENGKVCGQCYEVKCSGRHGCRRGSVKVTITDFCPPTPANARHCGPTKQHIDLGRNAFPVIADPRLGVINVQFRPVPCAAYHFLRITVKGNRYGWLSIVVASVPGSGRIFAVEVKGRVGNWEMMRRSWGAAYDRRGRPLQGAISVRVSLLGMFCKVVATNCIPERYRSGNTYQCTFRSSA